MNHIGSGGSQKQIPSTVDFSKLSDEGLRRYLIMHDISLPGTQASRDVIVAAVSRHFSNTQFPDEENTISTFVRACVPTDVAPAVSESPEPSTKRRKRAARGRRAPALNDYDVDLRGLRTAAAYREQDYDRGHSYGDGGGDTKHDDGEYEDDDDAVYCLCRGVSYGEMIACDNAETTCPYPSEWYHLACVGLSPNTQPETWYCPSCEQQGQGRVPGRRGESSPPTQQQQQQQQQQQRQQHQLQSATQHRIVEAGTERARHSQIASGQPSPRSAGVVTAVSGSDSVDADDAARRNRAQDQDRRRRGNNHNLTYGDMITRALEELGVGTPSSICDIIERDFDDQLNWKLEGDAKRTPVWKSSVRKILLSNPRFRSLSTTTQEFTLNS